LGLDLHYRQVTVAMQEDGGRIKSVGKMSHQAFGHWMDKKLAEGWQIESCYEAGASGYWLHRLLVALGVKNLVVAPKSMRRADRSAGSGDAAQGRGRLQHGGVGIRDEGLAAISQSRAGEQLYGLMSRDPPERWPRQGGFDQSLWQPARALEQALKPAHRWVIA
jgi:hypothetical protein